MLHRLVDLIFNLLTLLVLAHVLISWVPTARYHPISLWIMRVTEPMLRPFRLTVRMGYYGALDLSPLILLLLLAVLRRLILSFVIRL